MHIIHRVRSLPNPIREFFPSSLCLVGMLPYQLKWSWDKEMLPAVSGTILTASRFPRIWRTHHGIVYGYFYYSSLACLLLLLQLLIMLLLLQYYYSVNSYRGDSCIARLPDQGPPKLAAVPELRDPITSLYGLYSYLGGHWSKWSDLEIPVTQFTSLSSKSDQIFWGRTIFVGYLGLTGPIFSLKIFMTVHVK